MRPFGSIRGLPPDGLLRGGVVADGRPTAARQASGVAVDRRLLPCGGVRDAVGRCAVQRREEAASVGTADAALAAGQGARGDPGAALGGTILGEKEVEQGGSE